MLFRSSNNKEELERNMLKAFSDKDNHNKELTDKLVLAGFMAQVLGYMNSDKGKL